MFMESSADLPPQLAAAMALERETLSRECRLEEARLDAFLADDFHEFGRSGGEMTKVDTAHRVAQETADRDGMATVEDLRAALISSGVVMIKHTSTSGGVRTHRTSLWRQDPLLGWQMFHHQGTPTT